MYQVVFLVAVVLMERTELSRIEVLKMGIMKNYLKFGTKKFLA